MIGRNEKCFHIRLNLKKPTDNEIWEWLHHKEETQTISINSFLIEELRRMMISDKELLGNNAGTEIVEFAVKSDLDLSEDVSKYEVDLPETAQDFLSMF